MNERIEALKDLAIREAYRDTDTATQKYLHINSAADILAELIVEEVITVLQKRFMGDLNREDMEVRRCIADVKKHFGVEE